MKLKEIVSEMVVIDVRGADDGDKNTIISHKYYIYIQTLKKDLLIGPFDVRDEASEYMKQKTTNLARQKIVINGEEAKKLL